jgi:hypothetical protein
MQLNTEHDAGRVYLARVARQHLAKLDPSRREALLQGFLRVGCELLASAEQVAVDPSWSRCTWPRRRYPQQCYPKTINYVLDHEGIQGMRLMHGVVSHPPLFVPLDHAWVELPGNVVFDGVVQRFFSRASYYAVMSALPLDVYSASAARRMIAAHGHPGPWNASWVPTSGQLEAYAITLRTRQRAAASPYFTCASESSAGPVLALSVGRNR